MNETVELGTEPLFSVGAVEAELDKIFHDPHFNESVILKKFLSFIVQETICGRSNCLKEYTIAINVLEKPLTFNPQENCIVRIHAGRLRRALKQYYNDLGRDDQVVITIPKGKYIPVFSKRSNLIASDLFGGQPGISDEHRMNLAILPFICTTKEIAVRSFAEGLCLELSTMLMQLGISIIAYQAIKNLAEIQPDYKELRSSVGFNHMITGGVQCAKDKIRVTIQLVECSTYRQIWSESFERKITKSNQFDTQDEICRHIFEKFGELVGKRKIEQVS
jgi:TolB-like protein